MKRFNWLVLLFTVLVPLTGEQFYHPEAQFQINIPTSWTYDFSDLSKVNFLSDDKTIIVQVHWYPGDQFEEVTEMVRFFSDNNGVAGEGDESLFPYLDWQALLTHLTMGEGENSLQGWFLFLEGEEFDYEVRAYSFASDFENSFSKILSCLDSFAPGEMGPRYPGVVSELFYGPWDITTQKKTQKVTDRVVIYDFDPSELNVAQNLIEREALFVIEHGADTIEGELAWDRYYKLIYRDNYYRMKPFFEAIEPLMTGKSKEEIAVELLAWLQEFEYGSSGTLSDLISPLGSLVNEVGDCDSLSLVYLILLEYFDIEGVLLVSQEYAHAMSGVLVDLPGYTFPLGDKNYLVAELTKKVNLGMIAQDMTDPEKWQAISFTYNLQN